MPTPIASAQRFRTGAPLLPGEIAAVICNTLPLSGSSRVPLTIPSVAVPLTLRTAQTNHVLALTRLVGVAKLRRGKISGGHLDQREILRLIPRQESLHRADDPAGQSDAGLGFTLDHVPAGENDAVAPYDHPAALRVTGHHGDHGRPHRIENVRIRHRSDTAVAGGRHHCEHRPALCRRRYPRVSHWTRGAERTHRWNSSAGS